MRTRQRGGHSEQNPGGGVYSFVYVYTVHTQVSTKECILIRIVAASNK